MACTLIDLWQAKSNWVTALDALSLIQAVAAARISPSLFPLCFSGDRFAAVGPERMYFTRASRSVICHLDIAALHDRHNGCRRITRPLVA